LSSSPRRERSKRNRKTRKKKERLNASSDKESREEVRAERGASDSGYIF